MTRGRGLAVMLFASALLLGYLGWEWFWSPVARVKQTLRGVAEAAEALDAPRLLAYVAVDYSDFLDPDRASLERRLSESFSRVDRLNVTLRSIDVVVENDTATARFDLVVVAIRGDERYVVIGTPFEGEKIEAELTRAAGTWRIAKLVRTDRLRER